MLVAIARLEKTKDVEGNVITKAVAYKIHKKRPVKFDESPRLIRFQGRFIPLWRFDNIQRRCCDVDFLTPEQNLQYHEVLKKPHVQMLINKYKNERVVSMLAPLVKVFFHSKTVLDFLMETSEDEKIKKDLTNKMNLKDLNITKQDLVKYLVRKQVLKLNGKSTAVRAVQRDSRVYAKHIA